MTTTTATIHYHDPVDPAAPFNFRHHLDDMREVECVLSDEHARSSYGQPVVLFDGVVLGAGDLDAAYGAYSLQLHAPSPELFAAAAAAGYRVSKYQPE